MMLLMPSTSPRTSGAGDVSGRKDTEYALTPGGLASASEMVKKITQPGRAI
jgi:hypothetical protein